MKMAEARIMRLYGLMCLRQEEYDCRSCPLYKNKSNEESCSEFIARNTSQAINLIEEYAEENNITTRQERFLELFPNASIELTPNGHIDIKPCLVDSNIKSKECNDIPQCEKCKEIYWLG